MSFFKSKKETFVFYDGEGNKIERETEVRFDPLTGESSRLVFDPGAPFSSPDYTEIAEQTSGSNCPFCPENVFKLTPLFPKDIVPEGRVTNGEAVVAPNLFPYSKYNGVTIMSKQHYVRLEDFKPKLIADAFRAAQMYIEAVHEKETKPLSASINWNYLPHSGGSIIHPHLHVIVSESDTNYQTNYNEKAKQYYEKNGEHYLTKLYETEKQSGERWIGELGNVAWMHSYAPKSHNDFLAVFPNISNWREITEKDWEDFAKGLKAVFATLDEQGLASFNMMLHLSNGSSPIHARLIPRLLLNNLGTSDMNFFQSLHQEPLIYKQPEDIAEKARKHFPKE
jgi:UDPglucose--hexose-1-phosphate uridylyltransferase